MGTGAEADIAPRPLGDGQLRSADSAQFKRFIAGLDTFSTSTNEFQRADVAPEATFGDGRLDATDQQQIDNYIAALDPIRPGGGPAGPISGADQDTAGPDDNFNAGRSRKYRIGSGAAAQGSEVIISIDLDAKGNETGMSFTVGFDPTKLSFLAVGGTNNNPDVTDGWGSPPGMNTTVNVAQEGRGRIGLLLSSADPFETGARQILRLRFYVLGEAAPGVTAVTFDDTLLARSTTDVGARHLEASYENGEVIVTASRAGEASSWMSSFGAGWPQRPWGAR